MRAAGWARIPECTGLWTMTVPQNAESAVALGATDVGSASSR